MHDTCPHPQRHQATAGGGPLTATGAQLPVSRRRSATKRFAAAGAAAVVAAGGVALSARGAARASANDMSFLSGFSNVVPGPSTVPSDGDVNPYGVAVVAQSTGALVQGGVLVSNFNDAANAQGTGTTIVQVRPDGTVSPFAQITQATHTGPCPGGIGLTTALTILPGGFVVVGRLPTSTNGPTDQGTPAGIGAGCLSVLNAQGQLVETWSGAAINGPWDMTETSSGDDATLFVTNVLNGTVAADNGVPPGQPGNVVDGGTVLRIRVEVPPGHNPQVTAETVIGSGFAERTDPSALVVGPTGDALAANGTLYVSDSANSRIAAVPDALHRASTFRVPGGLTVSDASVLNDPLGMALASSGDILTVNGGDGRIVETSPGGRTVATATLDHSGPAPGGAGNLFGLAVVPGGRGIWFVDDGTNTLNVLF